MPVQVFVGKDENQISLGLMPIGQALALMAFPPPGVTLTAKPSQQAQMDAIEPPELPASPSDKPYLWSPELDLPPKREKKAGRRADPNGPVTGIRDLAKLLGVGRDVVQATLKSHPPPARAGRDACWFADPEAARSWWLDARAPRPTPTRPVRPRRPAGRDADPSAVIDRIGEPTTQRRK